MGKRQTPPATVRDQTVDDISGAHAVDPETVRRWVRRGCPADVGGRGRGHRLNSAEVAGWMQENGITGEEGRPVEGGNSPDLEKARLRKENALAAKYELQVQRERGELVTVAEVKQFNTRMLTTFRNKLRGIPASVSPHLDGRDGAEREVILARY